MRALSLLCLGLLVAVVPAQRRDRGPAPKLEHVTFQEEKFQSEALSREVPYGIYLPKGYDDEANKERRYPFTLWLHGLFEDHNRFQTRGGAKVLEEVIASGKVPDFVLVTVNGRGSFYINGKEYGRYEDMIVDDLLAHLRSKHRLRTDRAGCAIMGVSMGGMGALNLALRHPDKFCAVAAHSAALFPPDVENLPPQFRKRLDGGFGQQLGIDKIFGNPPDPKLWQENNPLHLAETMPIEKLKSLRIHFDCGDSDRYGFDEPNTELHQILEQRKVPHEWLLVKGGNHGWDYNPKVLPDALRFITEGWGKPGPGASSQPSAPTSRPNGGGDGMERSK